MIGAPRVHRALILPPPRREEVLLYAGVRGEAEGQDALLESCIRELSPLLTPRAVSAVCEGDPSALILGRKTIVSNDLGEHLRHARKIIVFAVTLGVAADRLIARYGHVSPSRAHLLDALASERIERAADVVTEMLASAEGGRATPRYSPGYGDLPLSEQKDILDFLDAGRGCGITLGEGFLMTPTKSITAFFGIL